MGGSQATCLCCAWLALVGSTAGFVQAPQACGRRRSLQRLRAAPVPVGHLANTKPVADVHVAADEWEGLREADHDRFLAEYWQKRPLLIRQALPGFNGLLSKDELAGLACVDDVESRIVKGSWEGEGAGEEEEGRGAGGEGAGGSGWEMEFGPFDEQTFSDLGDEGNWQLLVNEVNRHLPEVSDLLQEFSFIPSWRIDDVMVTYAPEGGTVGPHVDSYDVFLLQGSGRKRWSIENRRTSADREDARNLPDLDVRVLGDFKGAQEWVLEPGDALYLPPRIAHHGVSLDKDCMTYSIGFRSPSLQEMVTLFADKVADETPADAFYEDPDLCKQANPGAIDKQAVSRAKAMLKEALVGALDDQWAFEEWFGQHVTTSRRDHTDYPPALDPEELSMGAQPSPSAVVEAVKRTDPSTLAAGAGPFVYRAEGLVFAYLRHEGDDKGTTLFVDGKKFHLPSHLTFAAQLVCASPRLSPEDLHGPLTGRHSGEVAQLLQKLLLGGYLYAADD